MRKRIIALTLALLYLSVSLSFSPSHIHDDSKGLSHQLIQRRHVLRNAILPVVSLAGVHSGTLVGGAVLTETVFAWPGIGRLMYEALLQRDYNLLLGVFVVCSAMVLAFNLITDLIYRSVDPRIEVAA